MVSSETPTELPVELGATLERAIAADRERCVQRVEHLIEALTPHTLLGLDAVPAPPRSPDPMAAARM